MATYRNQVQRDFRLYGGTNSATDFSKIKVGRSTLSGDISTIIKEHDAKNKLMRQRYRREDIERAIAEHNIPKLREISNYFFNKSGIYSRACHYMAYLYRYDWYIIPERIDAKVATNKVIDGWIQATTLLENSNLKELFGEIALGVIKNGCYYGYVLNEADAFYLQELPVNYCRSRYKINGQYAVEFNVRYFDDTYSDVTYRTKVLKLFPKEIQKAYIAYKNGTLPKDRSDDETGWYLLEPGCGIKFNLHGDDAPLFVGVIPDIMDLDDAKKINKDKVAQQLLKIIIQKMPIDKNGDLIFNPEEAQVLHNNAVAMVGDAIGVDVLTTFADVAVADLSDNSNTTVTDELERFERSVYNDIGVSQLQFNTDGNIALEKSIANDEALMANLIYQFRFFVQRMLEPWNKNKKRLKYYFSILPTTIYNYKDLAKMYKEQSLLGFSKLLPQIAMGHTQSEVIHTALFENEMMSLNDVFIPPQMSSTMSSNKATTSSSGSSSTTQKTSSGEAGRPELPDDQKSTKTIQNKESAK